MSRLTKLLSLIALILFLLACSTVTQPIKDVQNAASTVQSIATAMPVDTLKAIASEIPVSTLEALPSAMPEFQAYINPQGTPVSEWNGIPIMSQATAGQEFTDTHTYSFKATATVKDAQDFYSTQLQKLGWSSSFSMPSVGNVSVQAYQKDSNALTVTIMDQNGSIVVILTMA
jgi:hypothetical protein